MYKKFFVVAIFCVLVVGIANAYDLVCKEGFVKVNTYRCHNYKTNLSYETYDEDNTPSTFWLNGICCGFKCDLDGKNCKDGGYCNENELKKNNYIKRDKDFYNSQTKLSFNGRTFYLNGLFCGYACNLDGKNCETGFCNVEECSKGFEIKDGKCYNSQTHLAYDKNGNFFRRYKTRYKWGEFALCGNGCDLDGKNCNKGVCHVDDCKEGYKNLNYVVIRNLSDSILIVLEPRKSTIMCRNNFKTKGYDVSEPGKMINFSFKSVEYYPLY